MTPILFESTESTFEGGGLGMLTQCLSCEVMENADTWEFECTFTYPTNGALYDEIKPGRIVLVTHDASRETEPFDIYAYEVGIDGIATFHARHISYRLAKQIRKPYPMSDTTNVWTVLDEIVNAGDDHNFELNVLPTLFEIDDDNVRETPGGRSIKLDTLAFGWTGLRSSRDLLVGDSASVASNFGYEYKWRRFNIQVYSKTRGVKRDVIIRYGRNVRGMTYECDYGTSNHAIMPFWVDSQTGATKYLTGINGDFTDPDTGVPVADSATIAVGVNSDGLNVFLLGDAFEGVPVDISNLLEREPTDFELYTIANDYFDTNCTIKPYENLTVDYADISDYDDSAQQLCLCDVATVYMADANVVKDMRVAKVTYDVLLDRYRQIELGNAQRSIYTVDSLRLKNTQQEPKGTIVVVNEPILEDEEP